MEALNGLVLLIIIAVISLFFYSIHAVKTYKSKMKENIQYFREIAETEEELEALKMSERLYDETLNASAPMLVFSSCILLSFIIAPFSLEKAYALFVITIFIVSPICLAVMAIFSELNIKTRHKYEVYDAIENLKDHALAVSALHGIASQAEKFAGSGKRQTDYFKSKNKKI